jgi:teichoic acid transport system ATP-binding protein
MPSRRLRLKFTNNTSPVAVRLWRVSKRYKLFKNERTRLLASFFKNIPYDVVTANDNLCLTIKRGESVALLGNNGAGKTTALKIISGAAYPDRGLVEVNGRVSALLNLSAGFDKNLTGVENLRVRGQIWGLTNEEFAQILPQIVEFSELGSFIDQPIRTYSSGMKARLGFAFASALNPDILILDEVLSAGDKNFQKKSLARIEEIISGKHVTVLFVTHSLSSARKFCERGIVIDKGRAIFDGPIDEAIAFYETNK